MAKKKPNFERLATTLARALRAQARFIRREDDKNCWCGGFVCKDSVACLAARVALKRYRNALSAGNGGV